MTTLNSLTPSAIAEALASLEKKALMEAFLEPEGQRYKYSHPRPGPMVFNGEALATLHHRLALRTGRISG